MKQEPGNLPLFVGLKRDAKRQFRGKKVQEAFRPEAQVRESPVDWQLYRQERTFVSDDERFGPARTAIVFRVRAIVAQRRG